MIWIMIFSAAPLNGFLDLDLPSFTPLKAKAATMGYYFYDIVNFEAVITGVESGISGDIVIPSTLGGYPVTKIDFGAFQYCNITGVTIPGSIANIDRGAFFHCEKLKKVILKNGVKSIGTQMFDGCTSLQTITIPKSVININGSAFNGCSSLVTIYYEGTLADWCNIAFDSSWIDPQLYPDKLYINGILLSGELVIPNGIKEINNAFMGYSRITGLKIPDSALSIDEGAFSYCGELENVVIGNGVTSIGSTAFYDCKKIKNVIIGNNVEQIGKGAFFGCKSLTNMSIPDNVKTIENGAFENCENLASVRLSENLTEIKDSVFYGCTSLDNVNIPNKVLSIGYRAFSRCANLSKIYFPDTLARIDDGAFSNCTSLEKVIIPDSVKTIGEYAFYKCSSLSSIKLSPYLLQIGERAFGDCVSLKEIIIPDSVTNLGGDVFRDCYGLEKITLSQNLTYIKLDTFRSCIGLQNIIIPESVTVFEYNAFYGCSNLKTITFSKAINTIEDYAFYYCKNLTDVYYSGSEEDWKAISIGEYNECLTNATIHFNISSPDIPDTPSNPDASYYTVYGRAFDVNLDYFAETLDSSCYSPELANVMAAFSKAVYSESDVLTAYDSFGFTSASVYDYGGYNSHTCGYALSFKKSNYSDDIIFLISVRGSTTVEDWIGNFELATFEQGKHIGFAYPANRIYNNIQSIISDFNMNGNIKFFITGHSRGGAVANLLSVKLMENGIDSSNIYNYNFACPDVACKVKFPIYNNIFNLCNREDIVPFIPGVAASALTTPGTSWGKFGKTYWFTKDAPDTINPFADHDMELYLEFFDQQLELSDWGKSFEDKIDDFVHTTIGWVTKVLCPVDVIITDKSGKQIASVINGEVNYYDSQVGDIIIFTDGDKKVVFIKGDKEFNINLVGTDVGDMTYSVEKYNVQREEILESKTFTNVKLEKGKQMYSPVNNAESVKDIELYVVKEENEKKIITHTVDVNGNETEIYRENVKEIKIIKPSTTTINYGDTLVLRLAENDIPEGYSVEWYILLGTGVSAYKNDTGTECRVTSVSNGSATFVAVLVDQNGKAVTDENGNEINHSITITSKAGLFQRLISFFKNLFGINRIIY